MSKPKHKKTTGSNDWFSAVAKPGEPLHPGCLERPMFVTDYDPYRVHHPEFGETKKNPASRRPLLE
ncbi:MAG: hypothetical protein ACK53X_04900 [Holosporales bacterium]